MDLYYQYLWRAFSVAVTFPEVRAYRSIDSDTFAVRLEFTIFYVQVWFSFRMLPSHAQQQMTWVQVLQKVDSGKSELSLESGFSYEKLESQMLQGFC